MARLRMFRRALQRQIARFEAASHFLGRDTTAAGCFSLLAVLDRKFHFPAFRTSIVF